MTALPSITVRLDDRAVALPAGATLAQLLELERREPAAVATALNGRFVPRDARPATALSDGDVVLFFQPIVGG
ncbi:sulfur carrier protein ThiS [Mitsuaria sp. TWR114]|uniref:sulfur carrier protein ThiS n=1 Tax=unclassified Roseateles TaxID=2626991 RepID=UPI0008E145E9|nr:MULTISPECIES: sulfur carrier protein ThiS [unclassified Roseateles]MBB3284313.1 sulfur carrier protein [Mitsuaria sp. BK037]MBB3291443.1 sulfur carrier protein [Mitsuaria sp. BK041]MBB3360660.1 sulfur carrier protein [Mitsuaria sp. BK045]TXD86184.1 sulfur carrier protein ThiS [Mitsuaria sp. TWR114]SFR70165.1 sulfur carrier protein ThiS [Mitsuaria sp. PDC51]